VDLREKVIFAGGCATALLITDPAIPDLTLPIAEARGFYHGGNRGENYRGVAIFL